VIGTHDRESGAQSPRLLSCPRCGLGIKPRARWLEIEHCPRCMARSRIAVRLFSSALPAAELDPDGSASRVARRATTPNPRRGPR
jgi:hypothetical protein